MIDKADWDYYDQAATDLAMDEARDLAAEGDTYEQARCPIDGSTHCDHTGEDMDEWVADQ